MPTEVMSPEETARRLAEVLCDVVNMTAILHNEPALQASDPVELRSALGQIVEGMTWVAAAVADGRMAGISWPPDAEEGIERLRGALGAWNPVHPPSSGVLDAARSCLRILQPA